MLTSDDLLDALLESLPAPGGGRARLPEVRGRPFLTEREIKGLLTAGGEVLRIPREAIVSPLAQDWLALKGVRLVRS